MTTGTLVKPGAYYDSVTLMEVAQALLAMDGIEDAAVVMGTLANKGILENASLLTPEAASATADDLVVAVRGDDEPCVEAALAQAEVELKASRAPREAAGGAAPQPKTLRAAVAQQPGSNIAVISVAGRYAAGVARDALHEGLHVFLFSDNVSVEDEVALKELGRESGRLVMGPDAGTAIINGVALGFANSVVTTPPAPGGVGIVAASGTGLQAVTSGLARQGIGITQAIGTGGRDLSPQVGGIMMIEALKALQADPFTRVLMLISKPPAKDVALQVLEQVQLGSKPAVVCFLGGKRSPIEAAGAAAAATLEEATLIAAELVHDGDVRRVSRALKKRDRQLEAQAETLRASLSRKQRYYRGLFSGGTFCYESQLILRKMLGRKQVMSNVPLNKVNELRDPNQSEGHTAVDLGEDVFTVGRLHPMLDPTLRNRRIVQEAHEPETAIIYVDIVLGYGVHPDPAGAAVEAIREAQAHAENKGRRIIFMAHVCGTPTDPQNVIAQEATLRKAGVLVLPSNAAATRLAGYILAGL